MLGLLKRPRFLYSYNALKYFLVLNVVLVCQVKENVAQLRSVIGGNLKIFQREAYIVRYHSVFRETDFVGRQSSA